MEALSKIKTIGKANKKKFVFIGLGVASVGILGFLGLQFLRSRKKKMEMEESDMTPPSHQYFARQSAPIRNDNFPLHKGSRGPNVKALQEALIATHGRSIMPRYGADGDFGSEMLSALKKLGLPDSINESTFNVITSGTSAAASINGLAKSLYTACVKKDFSAVLLGLKKIKSVGDYKTVSQGFVTYRLGGVRQTLVNGILSSFSAESQKQELRLEFSRMGLKYDGAKWSLAGLGNMLVATEPTVVWAGPLSGARVPPGIILGREIDRRGKYTLFENNRRKFLVKTNSIKYNP